MGQTLFTIAHNIDADRQEIMAFLQSNSDYAPASGKIIGILKQIGDEMTAGLAEATEAEEEALKLYELNWNAPSVVTHVMHYNFYVATGNAGAGKFQIGSAITVVTKLGKHPGRDGGRFVHACRRLHGVQPR